MKIIDDFHGNHRFLSNFFPCVIEFEGIEYPSTEHAYQAAKTLDTTRRMTIATVASPGAAKKLGKNMKLREDWDDVKIGIMEELLRKKFSQKWFKESLLDTGDAILIEGNTWNDTFWGVCRGVGQNNLGKLLMKIRTELKGEMK